MRRRAARRHELQRAHVVQAVGELDQENADVVGDREQQLAQVFGLLGLARNQLQPFQLGEAFDQRADFVPEHLVDFGAGRLGILDGVVQQRRDNGGVVELEVGEDRRDFERMRKIRIAGGAGLRAVRLHGVDIGAVQQIFVGIGVVGADAFDQIVLPHHARRAAPWVPCSAAIEAPRRPNRSRPASAGGCGANSPSNHCLHAGRRTRPAHLSFPCITEPIQRTRCSRTARCSAQDTV